MSVLPILLKFAIAYDPFLTVDQNPRLTAVTSRCSTHQPGPKKANLKSRVEEEPMDIGQETEV